MTKNKNSRKKNLKFTKDELVEEYIRSEELGNQLLKTKAASNLYLFNKYVLGVTEGSGKKPLGEFHKELCAFVQNDRDRKKLILVPRGHLKSTLVTIGYSLFRIVENPNIRILILNATFQMAVDFLKEIKDHLTRNPTLIKLFGKLAEEPDEWSQDRITLKRSDTGVRGPTVWATGVDSNLTGSHPDVIIMDDLVNRNIADSEDQMSKVIMRYKDALDLLEPGGQLIVIGTRWIDGDFYEWIMDPANNVLEGYDIFIRKAYESDGTLDEVFGPEGDGLIRSHLWLDKFTYKELKSRYKAKGSYEFSAQYLNDPVPDDEQTFRREWFQYADPEEWRGKLSTRYLTIDPAISLKKEADFTAMVVTEIDQFGNILIKDIERVKATPSQMISLIFYLAELHSPKIIGIEDVGFQKTLQYSIREEMRKRGRNLPIREISPQDRSKDQRIKALQPLYANGKIYHSRALKNLEHLETELLRFPRGKHDDVIDALSYHLDLIVPPRAPMATRRRKNRYLYG